MAQCDKNTLLHKIISALEQFQLRKTSLLSLDKVSNYLNLSEQELEDVLDLLFRFQALFNSKLAGFMLVKKWKNGKTYLTLKSLSEVANIDMVKSKEIEISKEQTELLNDIIYYFQHVKIGQGFNLKTNKTELSKKVKQFNRSYPFFFEHRGNSLIYPSKLAVEAGKLIQSYKKSKKTISKLKIEEYLINII